VGGPADLVQAIRSSRAASRSWPERHAKAHRELTSARPQATARTEPDGFDELIAREREVSASSRPDDERQIADALQLSPLTAKTHVSRSS